MKESSPPISDEKIKFCFESSNVDRDPIPDKKRKKKKGTPPTKQKKQRFFDSFTLLVPASSSFNVSLDFLTSIGVRLT